MTPPMLNDRYDEKLPNERNQPIAVELDAAQHVWAVADDQVGARIVGHSEN